MNRLRREIRTLLDSAESDRPAALRRSRLEDWLYATDLPQAAQRKAVADFLRTAAETGWKTDERAGWILLDRTPEKPPEDGFRGPFGPEAACCANLLQRHPGKRKNGDREARILLKAGEEGPDAYERACGSLHREWAAALRKGEALPDLAAEYFREG